MLQDSLSKIKYFIVLAVLLVLPMQAMAGVINGGFTASLIDQTDTGSNRVVAFWDTREGADSFIQITNTSTEKINIHVQLYDINGVLGECFEINFDDMLTANDTHVYDVRNLVTNSGPGLIPVDVTDVSDNSYGVMIVSISSEPIGSLIGMFRVIRSSGYEYRANAAGEDLGAFDGFTNIVNFSDANGNNLSDLVGIPYVSTAQDNVHLSPTVTATFGTINNELLIWDQGEFDTSCPPATFACAIGSLDRGIDFSLPNSLGQGNEVCATNVLASNNAGFLDLPFVSFGCFDPLVGNPQTGECNQGFDPWFVGFIGLNNGNGTGSMDSWWAVGAVEF